MKRAAVTTTLIALLALLSVGSACDREKPPEDSGPAAVAVVNGERITQAALSTELGKLKREGGALALRSEQDLDRIRRRLLEKQIDQMLLLQDAATRRVVVGHDEVERALLRMRADYPGRTFEELLADEGIPMSELKEAIRRRLVIQQLIADEVDARIAVTDEEVEAWYGERADELGTPEQVHAQQIVVKTEEQAGRILKDLRRGAAFEDMARRFSLAPEATQGGDLGWFAQGNMPSPIGETCFQLPVGRISEVVESPYGYHIFRVLERRKADKPSSLDAGVRRRIEERLRRTKEEAAQQAFLEALRASATITIDEKALAEVR